MRHDVINSEMSYNSASHSLMECYNQVVVLNKRKLQGARGRGVVETWEFSGRI